ncbi:MAG: TorD/DmsD family molecular chaperone [Desulfurella sp.]|uniref:TorD/DmsD family molecular chaperone n=1 Tax=Desulfurella sp. TaxID=1962857 RepID=UPI003D148BB9
MNKFDCLSVLFLYPQKNIIEPYKNCAENFGLKLPELEDLQVEYTRLFINAYPKVIAPPYESFWREKEIYGETTIAIKKLYAACNLDTSKNWHDLPDHIAAELAFLAYLEGNDTIEYQDIKARLLEEHLKAWVDKFCEVVKNNTTLEYFKNLSILLEENIYED